MAGEARIVQCGHCDFASGMRGMDRCGKCDGTGAQIVMPDGTRHALSDAGLRAALAAARREGQEEMRTRAAAACLRRAHASAEDDMTPIEEAVRDEAIYCARAIRALEIEG